MAIVLHSMLTCPNCDFRQELIMPREACQFFHVCSGCREMLKPKEGHCCIFCSYGSVPCPPMQQKMRPTLSIGPLTLCR